MPKNKNKRWSFIRKGSNTNTASNQSPISTDTQSWNIFRSLTELPLSRWISLTVDGYLHALVKDGTPPEAELRKAEHDLRIQYSDAAGDNQYRHYINLVNEITRLEITLLQVESLINTLRHAYHPLLAKELNRICGTSFSFDISKPEQYDLNLDRCFRRSRGHNLAINLNKIKIQEIEKKYKGDGGTATREYYMGTLIILSDEAGYPLTDQISTWEFLERIRRHNKKMQPTLKRKSNG